MKSIIGWEKSSIPQTSFKTYCVNQENTVVKSVYPFLKSILDLYKQPFISSLTVGSHGDEGSGGEEQDEDHVTAEEEPTQRAQVVEPGGCVSIERFMEEHLEVGLTPKCPNRPQTLQWNDEVGEDGAASCRRGEEETTGFNYIQFKSLLFFKLLIKYSLSWSDQ